MKDYIFGILDNVVDEINYYHSAINEELERIGCKEEAKYHKPINGEIDKVKEIFNKMNDEELSLMNDLIYHIITSAELQLLNEKQLNQRIKKMAQLFNELPVALM